jgi:hypothetical protein
MARGYKAKKNSSHFLSVQAGPPTGWLKSAFWFARHKAGTWRHIKPRRFIEVRSEIKTSKTQILCKQCTIELTDQQGSELRTIYIDNGLAWSRENTTSQTSIKQSQHRKLVKSFVALGFLEKVNNNKYILTEAGLRFLRHFPPAKLEVHDQYINYTG